MSRKILQLPTYSYILIHKYTLPSKLHGPFGRQTKILRSQGPQRTLCALCEMNPCSLSSFSPRVSERLQRARKLDKLGSRNYFFIVNKKKGGMKYGMGTYNLETL